MSDKCRFSEDCDGRAAYECLCKDAPFILCKPHLDVHIITPSAKGHNIKPILIPVSSESKQALISEILKLRFDVNHFKKDYILSIQNQLNEIYQKCNTSLSKIRSLESRLEKLVQTIQQTDEISLKTRPNITTLLQHPKNLIPQKFLEFNSVSLTTKTKNSICYIKIQEKISKTLGEEAIEKTVGKCQKNHKLLYSSDTSIYYSMIKGGEQLPYCVYCGSAILSAYLHCRICSFDICNECSLNKNLKTYKDLSCLKHHKLLWISSFSAQGLSATCNKCSTKFQSSGWKCFECNYHICENCCAEAGIQVFFNYPLKCLFEHTMSLIPPEKGISCFHCNAPITYTYWSCADCKFNLCSKCSGIRGYSIIHCNRGHPLVSYSKTKQKVWSKYKAECVLCKAKSCENGFYCKTCRVPFCEKCFLKSPQTFTRSQ